MWPRFNRISGLLICGVLACSEPSPQQQEVEVAFRSLVAALRARDAMAVYNLSVKEFHIFFDELYRDLRLADAAILKHFPQWEQPRTREHLLLDRLGGASDGRSLYLLLTDMHQLHTSAEIEAGLEHGPAAIDGNRAIIQTQAKEVFSFERQAGAWKTDVYLKAVRQLPMIQTLRRNIQTLMANIHRLEELYRISRDPKSPEGAFNQFVEALGKKDPRVIEALLDSTARSQMDAFVRYLRSLSAHAKVEPPATAAAYERWGIPAKTEFTSVRELLQLLLQSGKIIPDLFGVTPDSQIDSVEIESRTEATVHPRQGRALSFDLTEDGLWHLMLKSDILQSALFAPVGFTP